jgi:hypothetical protein
MFAVFREHQRKLLAVFAILAMIGFVLSDTLPRWMNSGGLSDRDLVVAELYGKKIHLSDLAAMSQKRQMANRFMAFADRFGNPTFFGGTTRAELIDALILEHEADRLGIPDSSAFARDWIEQQTRGGMNAALFELIRAKFDTKVSGDQLLADIASQARLLLAYSEVATPMVTPLDVFRNYRDQSERTSFKVVPFLAQSYVDKVGKPTEAEVSELFEKYKDVLPDPVRPTPGFKVPRKAKAEYMSIDVNSVAKRIKAKLSEEELKSYYESRKGEFPMDGSELPLDLFGKDAVHLTPPRFLPFSVQRDVMADALSREKANEEVQEMFATIREEVVDKFSDLYHKVEDDIADAKKDGASTEGYVLPKADDLSGVAKKYGLTYEMTPLIDRREAEHYGRISLAKVGSSQTVDSKSFASELFNPKTLLYEGFELNDILGDRYLVRKVADIPAHVPDLKDVHDEVVLAWKLDKARPLAQKAAEELAAKVKSEGGQFKDLMVGDRPVTSIESVTKLTPGMPIPSQFNGQFRFQRGPAKPTEIRQIPDASPALIETLFALKPGEVAIEPDLPKTTYYVLTLEKRDPISYMALMGPDGSLASYWSETQTEVMQKAYREGMVRLREQAGYHPENYPAEEKSRDEESTD